jgi:hypothetical protein
MEPKIKRKYRSFSLSLTTSEATATPIRFDDAAGGAILLGSGGTAATSLAVYASDSAGGAFGPVYKAGSAVAVSLSQSTGEPRVYAIPDEAYGCGAVKLVANNAAATTLTCVVMLKG